MYNEDYSWSLDLDDKMIIVIKHLGKKIFSISLCEAIELSSRKEILAHIRECDRTPWLKNWQEEAMEESVEILKGNTR